MSNRQNAPSIDILLATYNGSKYVEAQLYSLLAQTFQHWRLLIHDDGSSDDTVKIIQKFVSIDDRIQLLDDKQTFGNAGDNFFHILKNYSTAQYIVFCDQDDIWFENKLEIMLTHLTEFSVPTAVFASGYLYVPQKGITGTIPSPRPQIFKDLFFLQGGLQGCSLAFNRQLLERIQSFEGYIVMHDYLVNLAALTFGSIKYLDDKLMLYRQEHENKVTSNVEPRRFRNLLNKFTQRFPVIEQKHFKTLADFFSQYRSSLSSYQLSLFSEYVKFEKSNSRARRLLMVLKNGFRINKSVLALALKVILRPARK